MNNFLKMRSGSSLPVVSLAVALFVLAVSARPAPAAFILGFSQPVYTAAPNQFVDVPVLLTETGTNLLNTQGLNGGGLVLSYNVPTRVSNPAQVTLITPNPGTDPILDIVVTSNTAATATTNGAATFKFSQLLDPPLSAGGTSQILVGTFRFQAGSINGQVTNLSLSLATPGNQFVTGTGVVLDSMITTGTGQINVGGTGPMVPEPTSLLLCASAIPVLLGGHLLARARRKVSRRRATDA